MKDLQAPTITLMVYAPVNEQAYDEPSAGIAWHKPRSKGTAM